MSSVMSPFAAAASDAGARSHLPFGGLLRGELRRLRLRRLVLLFLLLYFVALAASVVIGYLSYDSNDPAALQASYDSVLARCERGFFGEPPSSGGGVPEAPGFDAGVCRAQLGTPEAFAADSGLIYLVLRQLPSGVTATATTFAILAFLLGASSIGADWSARTLPGLLTWEPRRIRLLLGRLLALLLVIACAAALAQAVHLGGALLLGSQRGTFARVAETPLFWPHVATRIGRGVLLACFFGTAGLAISALLRNTAAALGVAFAYLTLGEILLRLLKPGWAPYLVSHNVDAWMSTGGTNVSVPRNTTDDFGSRTFEDVIVHLSVARGGLYLALGAVVLFVVAAAVFRRRDIA
jgi:ABC-2 type transport system permease protein